jgi:hypothetical protein
MKKGGGFPYLIAANVTNGALLWGFRADPHPAAMITQSPTVYGGYVYVGVSSLEELIADNPDYEWWVIGLLQYRCDRPWVTGLYSIEAGLGGGGFRYAGGARLIVLVAKMCETEQQPVWHGAMRS